ncbi:hypothetical protein E3T37_11790 [Cryobacterium sp. TMT2-10]|uniref:Uncharacterized protein n=1 Tax=Cryobacterium shii TaxID=1259235 RepID=A0AAQ2C5I4_9MICO|nr:MULTISPECIES: hypothetical protein [Cryobacterium]TFC45608.1 hypothetical protein E3O49_10590 [Cryobacterium shii]TFC85784.1 hypothetical protein E3T24_07635 [Cryobacterium sp. TmT2-59]TFD16923.1 hypothetical protein E3T42_08420 [Cryobacterium sp. TMT4-10]TFD23599.1 hypothetical protein E3T32_05170 [Cryobacterium sp. TMT2-23]TFD37509.1 hypothetical protein E3T37_11790 [Cryobacterium sp. TMT2-10]
MTRVDIVYGGQQYSLGGRSIESIQAEVDAAVLSGAPYWMRVNSGGGRFEDAFLLIAPGIPFAMLRVKGDNGDDIDLDVDGVFNQDVL